MHLLRLLVLSFVAGLSPWLAPCALAADDFLDANRAFPLVAERLDARRLALRFDVAPGYYLYREKFTFEAAGVALPAPEVPKGKVQYDETFAKDVETLRGAVTVVLAVPPQPAGTRIALQVGNQGCADRGLCYPPQLRTVHVDAGPDGVGRVTVAGPRKGGLWSGSVPLLTRPQ